MLHAFICILLLFLDKAQLIATLLLQLKLVVKEVLFVFLDHFELDFLLDAAEV